MIDKTIRWYAWCWTLSVVAYGGSIPLGRAIAQAQAMANPEAQDGGGPAGTIPGAGEKRVVLRLIDEDGRPVAGATVGLYAKLGDPSRLGIPSGWNYAGTSDENGQVVMEMVDVFIAWRQTTLYILHEKRGIGAVPEITKEHIGERPPIVLTPLCRVRGVLNLRDILRTSIPVRWMYLDVFARNIILTGSFPAEQEHGFEMLLPSGRYSLLANVTEEGGKQGSYISNNVRFERRTFTVAPGQQQLDLGVVSLRPTKVFTLRGRPAPEIGPMKEWKNGSPVTLADLKGQLVWLHFGGDYPLVLLSLPTLAEWHKAFGDKGLTIVAIYNCDSMEELDRRWTEAYEMYGGVRQVPFRIAIDSAEPTSYDGTDQLRRGATHGRYDITRYPTNVLVDQAGNVIRIPDADNIKDCFCELLGLPAVTP